MLCSPKRGMAWQMMEKGIAWEDPLVSLQGSSKNWGMTSWGVFDCSGWEEIPLQKRDSYEVIWLLHLACEM